jgi:hypothetical protein
MAWLLSPISLASDAIRWPNSVSTQRRGKRSTKRTPSAVSNDATLRPTVNPQPPCGAGQSARLGQGNEMAKIFPVEHRCILAQAV